MPYSLKARQLKMETGAGKVVQPLKYFPCNYWDMTSSQNSYKRAVFTHAYNPSAGEEDMSRYMGLAGQPMKSTWKVPGQ